ncbi:hypothetical protein [Ensifer sp. SSB1]|uniref:hypothetical protein n=1 Tax=Ensifer sp. SSB1 TaxID=2795385 RepID=UPI001A6040F5|nr:hypothetical protein [Ensifer sp. SSB1]MBK5570208.1 hypothetical protein [Ensifer sp. SSB1]
MPIRVRMAGKKPYCGGGCEILSGAYLLMLVIVIDDVAHDKIVLFFSFITLQDGRVGASQAEMRRG